MLSSCLVFKEEDGEKTSVGEMLVEKLPVFVQSADLQVQERASCVLQLIKYVLKLQGKGKNYFICK